jgi:DNA-binding transcriptional regulator YdaS (Cro superfamily)
VNAKQRRKHFRRACRIVHGASKPPRLYGVVPNYSQPVMLSGRYIEAASGITIDEAIRRMLPRFTRERSR